MVKVVFGFGILEGDVASLMVGIVYGTLITRFEDAYCPLESRNICACVFVNGGAVW